MTKKPKMMAYRRRPLRAVERGFTRQFFCYLAIGYKPRQAWRIARINRHAPEQRPKGLANE